MNQRSTVLEINPRVWLPEQPWASAAPDLALIPDEQIRAWAEFGIDWIWMMGVWEPSPKSVEICLRHEGLQKEFQEFYPGLREENIVGSPYAVRDYKINTALGRLEKDGEPGTLSILRRRLNEHGIRLMLDFVPNHTATDHPWTIEHPEYYVRGTVRDIGLDPWSFFRTPYGKIIANGRDPYFPAWTDTAQLNYLNSDTRRVLEEQVLELSRVCDGLRCDMAMLVTNEVFRRVWGNRIEPPLDFESFPEFWQTTIARLKSDRPDFIFMAEVYWGMEPQLQAMGFDFTYDKLLYDKLAHGEGAGVHSLLAEKPIGVQHRCARFIENHDEPRAQETFGLRHKAAALIAASAPGLWLMHEGQWEGRRKKLPVQLSVRPSEPVDEGLLQWYRSLLKELRREPWRSGEFKVLKNHEAWSGNPTFDQIIAIYRATGDYRGLAVVNIGPMDAQCYVEFPAEDFSSEILKLRDLLSDAVYDRERSNLIEHGLYLALEAGHSHLFVIE